MVRRPPADISAIVQYYERWRPFEDNRRDISSDLKDLFAELKGNGLNPKAARVAFAEQYRLEHETAADADKRVANDTDVELYLLALARVREDIPEHDADGVIIEQEPATIEPLLCPRPTTSDPDAAAVAPTLGAGEDGFPLASSPTNSESRLECNPAPYTLPAGGDKARQPVLMQEGSVEGVRDAGATREHGSGEPSQPLLPSDRAENTPDGPDVIAAEPPSNVHAFPKRQVSFSDPPHPDCQKPAFCGGHSNLGLCESCRAALGQGVSA